MWTLEKLEARHQQELKEYFQDRERRSAILEKEQKAIVAHCRMVIPKTSGLLKNLLTEQRRAWEQMEKDDLDILQHIQLLERENFLDKQAKREELTALLSRGKDSEKDHSR